MAQLYQLIPLPQGVFSGLSLVERATFGLIYDRLKLSTASHLSSTDGGPFFDSARADVYCVYNQQDMAAVLGVSIRTVQRALDTLRDAGLIDYRKARYQDSNRYFIPYRIREQLKKP